MKSTIRILLASGLGIAAVFAAVDAGAQADVEHAVFVMTNDARMNEVVSYPRTDDGVLLAPTRYRTGGRGSGGRIDPLVAQGSLTLSRSGELLFAVNAGSGTLSMFRVDGSRLQLSDEVPTQGSEPNAVAQSGDLVYVLNTAGSSSVVGFRVDGNHLRSIPNSLRYLSGTGVVSSSLSFSPDGTRLVVAERGTNKLDTFRVQADGTLTSTFVATPSAGPGLFAIAFAPNGALVAAETGGGGSPSAMSSYAVQINGALAAISVSLPTLGAANCWNVITPDGRFVYGSNAGSSSISGFSIDGNGALSSIPGTVVGFNPSGSTNLDLAISSDGHFLFSLNAATGAVGMFAIQAADGSLTSLGTVGGLPAAAGLNGIAAN